MCSLAAIILRAAARLNAFFSKNCAAALCTERTTAPSAKLQAIAYRSLRRLPPRHLCGGTGAVKLGDDVHLLRRQLHRNRAHLLVDVVLPKTLGEGRELALDIDRLLRLQLRRAELMTATVAPSSRRPERTRMSSGSSLSPRTNRTRVRPRHRTESAFRARQARRTRRKKHRTATRISIRPPSRKPSQPTCRLSKPCSRRAPRF